MSEENSKVVGSIYFEFLDEIKNLPWYHEPTIEKGEYVYISEITVDSKIRIPELFNQVVKLAKENDCHEIIWLTGEKHNHDRIEQEFLKKNDFSIFKRVENWECSPGYFVHDHSLWLKKI